jgi:CrcB protein
VRLVLIGLAGAAGALCRLGVANVVGGRTLPLATLAVNVGGSFALGLVLAWASPRLGPATSAAVTVGFLGAFTTFSTFAMEAVALQEVGQATAAVLYVALSVVLGVGAAFAGQLLGRSLVAG